MFISRFRKNVVWFDHKTLGFVIMAVGPKSKIHISIETSICWLQHSVSFHMPVSMYLDTKKNISSL